MTYIPNILTFSRIIIAIAILFTRPSSVSFLVLYILAGLTDMTDGYIARRLKCVTTFGERLDSIADFVMFIVVLCVILPVINLPVAVYIWMIAIAIIRLASAILMYKTEGYFGMLHTIGNKITGFLIFMVPLLVSYLNNTMYYAICVVATVSAVQELIIHIRRYRSFI